MIPQLKAMSTGTKAAIGGGILLLAGLAIYLFVSGFFESGERRVEEAREAGATEAVSRGQQTTLDQMGDANDAEQDLRRSGERSAVRFEQCMLDSRERAACERYRPIAD